MHHNQATNIYNIIFAEKESPPPITFFSLLQFIIKSLIQRCQHFLFSRRVEMQLILKAAEINQRDEVINYFKFHGEGRANTHSENFQRERMPLCSCVYSYYNHCLYCIFVTGKKYQYWKMRLHFFRIVNSVSYIFFNV